MSGAKYPQLTEGHSEQTSPAERMSLGQVEHMRKCVSVISPDMGIRRKASSLPRRLFSLSRVERCPTCRDQLGSFPSLSADPRRQSAILRLLLPTFLLYFIH